MSYYDILNSLKLSTSIRLLIPQNFISRSYHCSRMDDSRKRETEINLWIISDVIGH